MGIWKNPLQYTLDRDSLVEQATQGDTVNIASMEPKADDAPRELVHYDERPMALQKKWIHIETDQRPGRCPSCVLASLVMTAHCHRALVGSAWRGHGGRGL